MKNMNEGLIPRNQIEESNSESIIKYVKYIVVGGKKFSVDELETMSARCSTETTQNRE